MWGRAGLGGRCVRQLDSFLDRGRLVGNPPVVDGSGGAVGPGGSPLRFPVCNAARATAELQPRVVVAVRPPTGAQCLLKGEDSVFICDNVFDDGLLVGTFEW
jgi:hypothetical protein